MNTEFFFDSISRMEEPSERLREARERAGYASAAQAAKALGVGVSTYAAHENGQNKFKLDKAQAYAKAFGVQAYWLLTGENPTQTEDGTQPSSPAPEPNARYQGPVEFPERRIPVYGQAVGGLDGEFVLNGERIGDVICPPFLSNVSNAYAVMVVGDSMSPRFEDGETVYVNPTRRCRAGDYVIAQVMVDEHSAPHAFVKRFVSRNVAELVLSQFNPEKNLKFPNDKVQSVHLIVATLSE